MMLNINCLFWIREWLSAMRREWTNKGCPIQDIPGD